MTTYPNIARSFSPADVWARFFAPFRSRSRLRRTHREMTSLSDEILRDIGLTRDEIRYLIWNGIEPDRHDH